MSRASKSWAGAFLAAAVVSTLTATVIPSQAAPQGASGSNRPKAAPVVVASGLQNPRDVQVQADGSILVAEAGTGSTTTCAPGTQCFGLTGAIYRVKGTTKGRVVTGLPSVISVRPDGSSSVGGTNYVGSVWNGTYRVVNGLGGTPESRKAFGAGSEPLGTLSIAKGPVLGDLAVHESLNDPDSVLGNNEVYSNPQKTVAAGSDFLVTDAGANDLIRVRPDGTTKTEAVFPNNTLPTASRTAKPLSAAERTQLAQALGDPSVLTAPPGQVESVPTGIVRGWDGAYYIADMSGIRVGLSRIWRYVPGSQPTVFASGLTGVLDLDLDPSGNLIALSYATGGTPTDPLPSQLTRINRTTGALTKINTDDRLKFATGLDVSPSGEFYVTNNALGTSGELLKFPAA